MKRLIVFLLVLMLCLMPLSGCKKTKQANSELGNKTEILLYDFEDYDSSFQLMKVMAYFGAVNVNKDSKYVKSGKVSALIQPLGPQSTTISTNGWGLQQNTCLYIPFTDNAHDFDYTDCRKIQTIKMSLYNSEEKNINVYFTMVFNKWVSELSEPVPFTLAPGWNEIGYNIDHNALSISHNLKSCYGIGLKFDKVNSRELKDAPKIYMDDIKLVVTEKPVKVEEVKLLNEDGVCNFDLLSQKYIVDCEVHDLINKIDLDVVLAKDVGMIALSGQKLLRAVLKPTDSIDGTIYEKIVFKQKLAEALDIKNADDNDRFCFDIYNDSDEPIDFAVIFRCPQTGATMGDHLYASPHQWTAFSKCFVEMKNDSADYRTDTGQIEIHYAEFEGKERVIYIDNIRIEK